MRSETKKAWLLILPAFIYLLVITLFPFIYTLYASLNDWYLAGSRTFIGFKNYFDLLDQPQFWSSLKVTLYFVGSCLFFEHIFGLILALLLSSITKFRGILVACFVIPMMLPPIVGALIWTLMYRPLGVLNYFLQLINLSPSTWVLSSKWVIPSIVIVDVWEWTPFVMLIMLAGINAIPGEIYQAVEIDGGGYWTKIRYVIVPLLKPLLVISFLLRFIFVFTTFDIVAGLSQGGPGYASTTLYFYSYLKSFKWLRMGEGATLNIVIFVVTLTAGMFLLNKVLKQ